MKFKEFKDIMALIFVAVVLIYILGIIQQQQAQIKALKHRAMIAEKQNKGDKP